jgi:hypothetical protein
MESPFDPQENPSDSLFEGCALAIPIELYMALAICIVIEILGALVWRFLMIECGKEKSRPWEAEALENEGGTPFHSG